MSPDQQLQQVLKKATEEAIVKRIEQISDDALRELKKLKQREDTVIKQIEQQHN